MKASINGIGSIIAPDEIGEAADWTARHNSSNNPKGPNGPRKRRERDNRLRALHVEHTHLLREREGRAVCQSQGGLCTMSDKVPLSSTGGPSKISQEKSLNVKTFWR